MRVPSPGVSSFELQELVSELGSRVAAVCFEVCTGKSSSEKRRQAKNNRDYMRLVTHSDDVYGGLAFVNHPAAPLEGLDLLLNFAEHNRRRYHVAVERSLDFTHSDGRTVLADWQRKLAEKLLELNRTGRVSLESSIDPYRMGTSWDRVRQFFPECPNAAEFERKLLGLRGIALELYTALTVAAHTNYGAVIADQIYPIVNPTDGRLTSDIDVLLVTSKQAATATLASLQREPGATLVVRRSSPVPSPQYNEAA